jgi:hypothetical protein
LGDGFLEAGAVLQLFEQGSNIESGARGLPDDAMFDLISHSVFRRQHPDASVFQYPGSNRPDSGSGKVKRN